MKYRHKRINLITNLNMTKNQNQKYFTKNKTSATNLIKTNKLNQNKILNSKSPTQPNQQPL